MGTARHKKSQAAFIRNANFLDFSPEIFELPVTVNLIRDILEFMAKHSFPVIFFYLIFFTEAAKGGSAVMRCMMVYVQLI